LRPFARLLDALLYSPSRLAKERLILEYLRTTPDPDRGFAVAALTGDLNLTAAKPALVRQLAETRVDPVLFGLSYDFVGDLAETVALIWPQQTASEPPRLSEVVHRLTTSSKASVPALLDGWLDRCDATERWALLKLITGALRVGVSARLTKGVLADLGKLDIAAVEEVWHGLQPPYQPLFAWLLGAGPRPEPRRGIGFRPAMLAHPLEETELAALDAAAYRAEWKWDGIRVQIVAADGQARLYSRTGDDIGGAFPDVIERIRFDAVLDGELLIVIDGEVRPFNDLQQRLNRKRVTAQMLVDFPAHVRLYDMLFDGAEDLRELAFDQRRTRLEAWHAREQPAGIDLSPLVPFASWGELAQIRAGTRARGIEGLMLKRGDSAYVAGRPRGPWFKWKRGALTLDTVLMYAQRGHGKRSSYYSDYTFGAWREGELVPIGKAYFGFTDEELLKLDKWVRDNTVERYGPVRQVRPGLVLEVAFDAVQTSSRHKSGVALRFPRIHRIRWDKPIEEADRLESVTALIEA
jgi:DNA ligase 1